MPRPVCSLKDSTEKIKVMLTLSKGSYILQTWVQIKLGYGKDKFGVCVCVCVEGGRVRVGG